MAKNKHKPVCENPAPEPIQLTITDLNTSGQGIARLPDGLVCFVDQAVPGDELLAQLVVRKKQYAVARMLELLRPSPARVEPFCPVAGRCGGCQLQALDYEAQLRWKARQVAEALRRIGRLETVDQVLQPILGMPQPFAYRNKAQFPVRGTVDQPEIGFYARNSHTVVDSTVCGIQHPVANILRAALRAAITTCRIEPYQTADHRGLLRHFLVRLGFATKEVMVVFVINGDELPQAAAVVDQLQCALAEQAPGFRLRSAWINHQTSRSNVILGDRFSHLAGERDIRETLLGYTFRISPASFFQVNPSQTEVLYRQVRQAAQPSPDDVVLDLYCGTGTIGLSLAPEVKFVHGVELVAEAIDQARQNAADNNLTNGAFTAAAAEHWLPDFWARGNTATTAILDPPRKGCDPALLDALLHTPLRRLVYVSCNPATLARDVAHLSSSWQVQSVQPVDLFPWTTHVETVVLMSKADK